MKYISSFFALFISTLALAQSPRNVLLVLNETSPVSLEIGQYYAEKRGLPGDNILRLRTRTDDEIPRAEYERLIEAPVAAWLMRNDGHDRILYIVLTKGMPLRISGTSGADGAVASVDSELALLYRKMTAIPVPIAGRMPNPYFLGESNIVQAKRFTHKDHDIFLVSRLDGYTSEDVRRLVDRALLPSREGKILLDAKGASTEKGNDWLHRAARSLESLGFKERTFLETSEKVLRDEAGVLGYYSWGSNDPAIRVRHFGLQFVSGALAGMYVSSDARTFVEPPSDWQVGPWDDKSPRFAGSPQSMAGDLIREGVTGIAGHVAEPFLEATIRPDILFPAYLSGYNLIEAYYLAMPFLSWQTVVLGDPLCAPFRSSHLSDEEIDPGINEETDLPNYFSPRRSRTISLAAYQQSKTPPDAIKALLRAEVRMAKGDTGGARRALETATSHDSRLVAAHFLLASLYEQAGEYDKAIERYRRIVEVTPDNALVMNNLAYGLAVRQNKPMEALPFAARAYDLAQGNANIADTLGWVHHLLGGNERAYPYVQEAARAAPKNAEIQLHAAVVAAAIGRLDEAGAYLKAALELDPKLETSDDIQSLRTKLKPPDPLQSPKSP